MNSNTVITKDAANKKLHVTRHFAAPVDKVWKAWTESSILDKWWAPKPFRAETKSMDFSVGGSWLYCMAGPAGERHWCRVDYTAIDPSRSFASSAMFCDEQGVINKDFPAMHWFTQFHASGADTRIEVEITFDEEADMQKIIEMGFEGGFSMGLGNLDEVLAAE